MITCEVVQDRLAELGAATAQRDETLRDHLLGCADCQAVSIALKELDAGLTQLAGPEAPDAPDALVEKTLLAVRSAAQKGAGKTFNRPWIAGVMAASLLLIASVGLVDELLLQPGFESVKETLTASLQSRDGAEDPTSDKYGQMQNKEAIVDEAEVPALPRSELRIEEKLNLVGGVEVQGASRELGDEVYHSEQSFADTPAQHRGIGNYRNESEEQTNGDAKANAPNVTPSTTGVFVPNPVATVNIGEDGSFIESPPRPKPAQEGYAENRAGERYAPNSQFGREEVDQVSGPSDSRRQAGSEMEIVDSEVKNETKEDNLSASLFESELPGSPQETHGEVAARLPALKAKLRGNEQVSGLNSATSESLGDTLGGERTAIETERAGQDKKVVELDGEDEELSPDRASTLDATGVIGGGGGSAFNRDGLSELQIQSSGALDEMYLNALKKIDGLTYQEARGYWLNSYIPGDPEIRVLEARLKDWNRAALGANLQLERGVRPVAQPFDKPQSAAMALTLRADTRSIEGPARLRLQVGLQGAERQGGRRPAMNVGLVLDLRHGIDIDTARRIRALVTALEIAYQPGDRFSLTVAGPGGGLLIAPDDFRHGPVKVTLDRLFRKQASEGGATELMEALSLASASLREGDRPEAILGSSLLILATGSSLASDLTALETRAHQNALEGLHTSAIALGANAVLDQIDRLVAAGQGNRRVLAAPDEAERLIEKELYASTRAVARALRLRIRLAPGVKLVDVLGSHRLDEPRAQAVREVEQSIDQRLAQNLFIATDRGEDEEGIQIVIPNFFAGDSHVILLDLVAAHAGPIADVTLRYKDLVDLDNGIAQANLALPNGASSQGPLELNVLKNLIAWETAQQARIVSRELRQSNIAAAQARLGTLLTFLQGLRARVRGWASDAELAADEALLNDYLTALRAPALQDSALRQGLADSLRLAAHRKLLAEVR